MTNLSDQFLVKSGGLLKKIPEPADNSGKYSAFDDGGVECEVGEFLYGLVRATKPERILETGTYSGISSMYMAEAMKDNGLGHIWTIEINEFHKKRAEELWNAVGVSSQVTCVHGDSTLYNPKQDFDMLFLDSEPEFRFQELVIFYDKLKPGGYAFVHDLPRGMCQGNVNPDHPEISSWPFGDLPEQIKNWIKKGELSVFHIPNPRGMVGFYKKSPEDYVPTS